MVVLWPWQRWCKHDLLAAVTCSGPAQDWPWRQSVTKTHVALSLPDERLATEIWGEGQPFSLVAYCGETHSAPMDTSKSKPTPMVAV